MFADDTNLFCSNGSGRTLFSECFKGNKLLLNVDKTKYAIFNKLWNNDNQSLKLQVLSISKYNIKRSPSRRAQLDKPHKYCRKQSF